MKSLAKRLTVFCGTSLLIVASSVAADLEPTLEELEEFDLQEAQYAFFLPELPSEGTVIKLNRVEKKPVASSAYYSTCKAKKRNELYELTAIFNDKLQMFLSSFDDKPHYHMVEKKEDKEAVPLDKEVTL